MKRKIYYNMCLLAGFTILLTSLLVSSIFYQVIEQRIQKETKDEALYAMTVCNYMDDPMDFLEDVSSETAPRITLVAFDGTVLYDSETDHSVMENHGNRTEIIQAKVQGYGEDTRLSETLQEQTYYYAVLLDNGTILRLAGTMDSIFTTITSMIFPILAVAAITIALALLLVNHMAKSIISPINSLDLKHPKNNKVYDELQPLLDRLRKQNTQIRMQMEDIMDQQNKTVAITENMSEGLILLGPDETIISVNKSCMELLHAPNMDFVGKKLILLNRSAALKEAVTEALNGNKFSSILEIDHKFLQIFANPVSEEDNIRGVVLFILDVTEKQRGEKIRKEFSANVSHELKTPLTSISGYAELLQTGLVPKSDVSDFAGKIYKEAGRLIALVNDIIKISQLDEKNVGLEKEYVNLYLLAKSTIERLQPVADIRGVTLKLEAQNTIIYAVPQMMDELVYNLCENAVKYNIESGKVDVIITEEDEFVKIEVSDTGIGISPRHQERIFERFYRVDKSHSKQTGGTGLGLAIVKHVAEYHDGFIEVHSDLGKGSCIAVYLPLRCHSEE